MKATLMFILVMTAAIGTLGACLAHNARKDRPSPHREPLLSDVIEYQRAQFGLPRGMIEAVIDHETAGTWDEKSFNPEKKSKCYRMAVTKADKEKCASRGLMQVVYKWHNKLRGKKLEPRHLDDPFTNVSIGVESKLGPCWKEQKTVWGAYRCYNGSGKDAQKYANTVIKKYHAWSKLG